MKGDIDKIMTKNKNKSQCQYICYADENYYCEQSK